jgi:hypothetical protein
MMIEPQIFHSRQQAGQPSPRAIGAIVLDGLLFDPKNWNPLVSTPNLDQILQAIHRLFTQLNENQVPYVLVGGVAMLAYIQGRNTQDVDLIMAREDGTAVGLLISSENRDFAQADYDGVRVDLLLNQNPLFKIVQMEYTQVTQFGEHAVITATPAGLVILKLYALPSLYRQGLFDRAVLYETDILQLVFNYQLPLDPLLELVKPYLLASDLAELRTIVTEIQGRIRRMGGDRPRE